MPALSDPGRRLPPTACLGWGWLTDFSGSGLKYCWPALPPSFLQLAGTWKAVEQGGCGGVRLQLGAGAWDQRLKFKVKSEGWEPLSLYDTHFPVGLLFFPFSGGGAGRRRLWGWEPSPAVSAERGWCLLVAVTAGSAARQWHSLRLWWLF